MKFRELYTSDKYYTVGVDDSTGTGVIVVTITGVGWYDLYFRITDEELADAQRDPHALDDLAQRLAVDKGKQFYSDRLLKV